MAPELRSRKNGDKPVTVSEATKSTVTKKKRPAAKPKRTAGKTVPASASSKSKEKTPSPKSPGRVTKVSQKKKPKTPSPKTPVRAPKPASKKSPKKSSNKKFVASGSAIRKADEFLKSLALGLEDPFVSPPKPRPSSSKPSKKKTPIGLGITCSPESGNEEWFTPPTRPRRPSPSKSGSTPPLPAGWSPLPEPRGPSFSPLSPSGPPLSPIGPPIPEEDLFWKSTAGEPSGFSPRPGPSFYPTLATYIPLSQRDPRYFPTAPAPSPAPPNPYQPTGRAPKPQRIPPKPPTRDGRRAKTVENARPPRPRPTQPSPTPAQRVKFSSEGSQGPITPRRFERELKRLQERFVTDPAAVEALRRERAERRAARAEREVQRGNWREREERAERRRERGRRVGSIEI